MALNSLPILFYNLGGEMLYVLDQRLRAQSIPTEKAAKVISDIVGTMFNPQFLTEMMKPQQLYSKQGMRTMFSKLVHSSIMKVNEDSMEKLYDLMIMAAKQQFSQCGNPTDILHITLNHFDAILEFVKNNTIVYQKVSNIFQLIVEMYSPMTAGDFILVRQSLLGFLQDTHNKVSIYLSQKVQNEDGRFVIAKTGEVPIGCNVPGIIHLFQPGKKVVNFTSGCNFKPHTPCDSSLEIGGQRSTTLGTNIYTNCHSTDYCIASINSLTGTSPESNRLAKAELGLLAQIIGSDAVPSNQKFRLQLFSSNNESFKTPHASEELLKDDSVVNIKATKQGAEELSQIADDLMIGGSTSGSRKTKGEDLLSLMDS